MDYNRLFSLIVSAIYLIGAALNLPDHKPLLYTGLFLIFPLLLIWFGNELGRVTGINFGSMRPAVNQESPGCLVKFSGWLLLLVPFWIWLIEVTGFTD